MLQAGRSRNAGGYRFGFNGMENDNKKGGLGEHVDFGARGLNTWTGKFYGIDPLWAKYPSISPYAFVANSPIWFVDRDGRDIVTYDEDGKEVERIKSDKIFRTRIRVPVAMTPTSPHQLAYEYEEATMPNIIQERTQSKENTSEGKYQENDYLIAARVALFNRAKNNGTLQLYTDGGKPIPQAAISLIPDLDVTRVKAMAIQESHNGVHGEQDILTANNHGDWENTKSVKMKYGMSEYMSMSKDKSLKFGILILASKGFKFGIDITYDNKNGIRTKKYTFQGWDSASKYYNYPGVERYQEYINEMIKKSRTPNPGDYEK